MFVCVFMFVISVFVCMITIMCLCMCVYIYLCVCVFDYYQVGPAGSQFGMLACHFVELLNAWPMLKNPWRACGRLVSLTLILFTVGLLPWVSTLSLIHFLYLSSSSAYSPESLLSLPRFLYLPSMSAFSPVSVFSFSSCSFSSYFTPVLFFARYLFELCVVES